MIIIDRKKEKRQGIAQPQYMWDEKAKWFMDSDIISWIALVISVINLLAVVLMKCLPK